MKLLVLSVALLSVFVVSGQTAFDKTVDATCTCLKGKEGAFEDQNSLQMAMMDCAQGSMLRNMAPLMEERGITDMNDMSAMTKLGNDIGVALLSDCPTFRDNMQSMQMEMMGQAPRSSSEKLDGSLVSIEKGNFSYLKIKKADGTIESVYWMESFGGDEILLLSPDKMVGQNVQVSYSTRKVYNSESNSYKEVKIVEGISLMQK